MAVKILGLPWGYPKKLSVKDWKKLEATESKWTKIATNTGPCDREVAQEALKEICQLTKIPQLTPKWFLGREEGRPSEEFNDDQANSVILPSSRSRPVDRLELYLRDLKYNQIGTDMWLGWTRTKSRPSHQERVDGVGSPISLIGERLGRFFILEHPLMDDVMDWSFPDLSQFDITEMFMFDSYRQIGFKRPGAIDFLTKLLENVGAVWLTEKSAFLLEHPLELCFDSQERLHNETGPAVTWRDGTKSFFFEGIKVPDTAILDPQNIPVSRILSEPNVQTRTVMINRFGREKFLIQSHAAKLSRSDRGTLWQVVTADDPINVLEVQNSTPEIDGSFRHFFVGIPPNINDADEAVAWTFEMNKEEYSPGLET